MLLDADDCQLVLIDYQARLMPAIHDAAAVVANARRLAQMARLVDVPVWATEQNPTKLGGTDEALAALCDRIVPKMAFSGANCSGKHKTNCSSRRSGRRIICANDKIYSTRISPGSGGGGFFSSNREKRARPLE